MYRDQNPKAEEMFEKAGVKVRKLETDFTEKIALMQKIITATRE